MKIVEFEITLYTEDMKQMSSLFQKMITALTGLGLVGFVLVHLAGNLTLYSSNPDHFNAYADQLQQLDAILEIGEVVLIGLFGLHILNGFLLKRNNLKARPQRYQLWKSKKGPSYANKSSLSMIITGSVLTLFLILHIKQFHFGPNIQDGYATQLKGREIRDLYRLVSETFQKPEMVLIYVVAMTGLGLHLRHGLWSAFQTMGVSTVEKSKPLRLALAGLGVLLALGFLGIPLWMFLGKGI